MHVKWNALFCLGFIFVASLCLYDYYYINPETKTFYFSQEDIRAWEKEKLLYENEKAAERNYSFSLSLILWNIFTFIATVFVCSTVKISLSFLNYLKESTNLSRRKVGFVLKPEETANSNDAANNENEISKCSKIPVYINSKTSLHSLSDYNDEKDKQMINSSISLLSHSTSSFEVSEQPSKSNMSGCVEKQIEKRCAQLREEMLVQQSNSLKEHAVLSRRLEVVSREKRDLMRQLMIVQKDNRSTKQQLEELVAEKELLVKRLDCASKEFKVNTSSKKMALAKLDDAHTTINELTAQLELTTKERETLQNKIKILSDEHKSVKNRLSKTEPIEIPTKMSPEPKFVQNYEAITQTTPHKLSNKATLPVYKQAVPKEVKKLNLSEITQSQQDVQKVQERLINLEKSLNKLKLQNTPKNADITKRDKLETEFLNENFCSCSPENIVMGEPIPAQLSIDDLKHRGVEILTSRNDNLTDEQRRKILEPADSSGDENFKETHDFENLLDFTIEDPFERSLADKMKSSQITLDNETSTTNDENEDGYQRPRRKIVSNSPAFQKFLRTMDHVVECKEHKLSPRNKAC